MNKKSAFITLVISTAIFVHVVDAQAKKLPRIGWLSLRQGPTISPAFMQGLRKLGWFAGENILIEARFADQRDDQLPKLAAELIKMEVDIIVAADTPVIRPAKNATRTIPIVMTVVGDPVSRGHVASLARPGGNITGLSNDLGPLDGKRLEILKQAVPSVSRVAVFDPTGLVDWKMMETVSRALGIKLRGLPMFKRSDELEGLFKATLSNRTMGYS
jgi:putative ABC transport system substrate-binding protein